MQRILNYKLNRKVNPKNHLMISYLQYGNIYTAIYVSGIFDVKNWNSFEKAFHLTSFSILPGHFSCAEDISFAKLNYLWIIAIWTSSCISLRRVSQSSSRDSLCQGLFYAALGSITLFLIRTEIERWKKKVCPDLSEPGGEQSIYSWKDIEMIRFLSWQG